MIIKKAVGESFSIYFPIKENESIVSFVSRRYMRGITELNV